MADDGDLIAELHAMPVRSRQAILRSLSRGERAEVVRRLAAADTVGVLSVDGHSPWLAELIAMARTPDDRGGAARLTAATRQILAAGTTVAAPIPKPNGRSLLDAVGSFAMRRKPA